MGRAAATELKKAVREAVQDYGWCTLVLSGGRSPAVLYACLAENREGGAVEWGRVHLFWGDERCVPGGGPGSNYAMAYKTLISTVSIPRANIHAIQADEASPERAARHYTREIRSVFSSIGREQSGGVPAFDIMLLGMGADGHTASLFPGDDALLETERWVRAVRAPAGYDQPVRITMTLPVINSARRIFFIVSGRDKTDTMRQVTGNRDAAAGQFPAARVIPKPGMIWYVFTGDE